MMLVDSATGHALWARSYDTSPNPVIALEQRTLSRMMPRLSGLTVADIGCGTGRWARAIQCRARTVISVDLCPEMLCRAPSPRVIGDARRLPLRCAYADLTVCAMALSYAGLSCLAELARITRPGGRVLVSDLHPAAIASGWTRSFRADGREISIVFERYSLRDLVHPDLDLLDVVEVALDEPEREIFARAGREHGFAELAAIPAVFVAAWTRRAD